MITLFAVAARTSLMPQSHHVSSKKTNALNVYFLESVPLHWKREPIGAFSFPRSVLRTIARGNVLACAEANRVRPKGSAGGLYARNHHKRADWLIRYGLPYRRSEEESHHQVARGLTLA